MINDEQAVKDRIFWCAISYNSKRECSSGYSLSIYSKLLKDVTGYNLLIA